MMRRFHLCAALLVLTLATPAAAQGSRPFPGIAQDQSKDQPVQIEAATLEVRDKAKTATFAGDV